MPPVPFVSLAHIKECGVVPASVRCDERVSLFRTPAARLVAKRAGVGIKDWIDHRPGGLNRVLAGEECAIAGHGVTQQPLAGCFLPRLFFQQVELALVADELLAGALDARGQGDGGVGRKPEAQVIGPPGRRRGIVEQPLRWRL